MSLILAYNPVTRLEATFAALGIPLAGDSFNQFASPPTIAVTYAPTATQAQITQGNTLLASWDMRTYQTRTIADLLKAIQALTSTQQNNIGNDLFTATGGDMTTMKVLADAGGNNSAIWVLWWAVLAGGAGGVTLAKQLAAAMYAQDNPTYLIQPAFDTTINIAGWAPVG